MEIDMKPKVRLLLDDIFRTKELSDANGNKFVLNSNIDQEEGRFLHNLIVENSYKKSVEVGCAYGISSLFICGALSQETGSHLIIDPFQTSDWNSIGITQLKKAGIENFNLIEKGSEIALPELLAAGAKFDFAFIDGWHTFDHTLLDMFYLNKMLKVGGIMVIDDVGMKSVNRAVNYFLNYPAYEFNGGIELENTKSRERFNKYVTPAIRALMNLVPTKVREEIFSKQVLHKGLNGYSMVALRKVNEDERPWNWYKNF